MRLWKVATVGFSTLFVIGMIGTGVSMGQIYKSAAYDYDVNLSEVLDITKLNELKIDSEIPLTVETTTGTPKVVIDGTVRGIFLEDPQYSINVSTEGTNTQVKIDRNAGALVGINFGTEERATLYLPEQLIEKVTMEASAIEYEGKVNIGEFVVDASRVEMDLKGSVKEMAVDTRSVDMKLQTQEVAEVTINADYGEVELDGKYNYVEVNSQHGNVDVDVDTTELLDTNIETYGDISLEGILGYIQLYGGDTIEVEAMNQPESIDIWSDYGEVSIRLPQDITGIYGMYKNYENYDGNQAEGLFSNFDLEYFEATHDQVGFRYGDGAVHISIETNGSGTNILH